RNQSLLGPTGQLFTQVNNIAAASIEGIEIENALQFGERWTLTLNYAYTRAKYNKYPGTTTDILGNVIPNIQTPFIGTPKHQGTAGIRYLAISKPSFGDLSLSGSYYRQSSVV